MPPAQENEASSGLGAAKVSVRGLTKRFGDLTAVDGVDLDIRDGEFLTLLGPSGCGKTTLMRLIAGLEQPDEGKIFLDGEDVTALPPRDRRLGMVFQQYALFPHMSVRDNIAYGLEVTGASRRDADRRVDEMIVLVRLEGLGARFPNQLSGGQQQRVALARALATAPSVLMLDEPLGALDLQLRRGLQSELRRIHRETAVTFLYVTHDQEEALHMSDRIGLMRNGNFEQLASPETLYDEPASAFVAEFVGEVSMLRCRPAEEGRRVIVEGTGQGISIGTEVIPEKEFFLVVRPEAVTVQRVGSPSGPEDLPGTIVDAQYVGGGTTYEVELAGGQTVKAHGDASTVGKLDLGSEVHVSIEGASVCLTE